MIYEAPLVNLIPDPKLRAMISSHPSFLGRLAQRDELRAVLADAPVSPTLEERRHFHEVNDRLKRITHELDEMKDAHAAAVADMFPTPPEHDIEIPEGATTSGTFPSGSAEWLRQRQHTLGGSDVGAIMKIDPEWGESNYRRVRESKLDPDPQDQDHSGAAGRGDIWEPALISMATSILGEDVFVNKETLSNGIDHANLDGFTVEDGAIKSIVECKTSSFPREWTAESIPSGYVLQVEHYMNFYGVEHAYLIVNIDDRLLRIYSVNIDDNVPASKFMRDYVEGDGVCYFDVVDAAHNFIRRWNSERARPRPSTRLRYTRKWRDPWEVAVNRGMVFLDLETTTFTPKTGHIIEIGAVADDGETFSEFFGVPEDHFAWNGVGAEDLHHIHAEDVEGKPVLLYSDEWIQRLRDFVGDRVVIAHNASFEKRWLDYLGTHFDYADTTFAFSALVDDAEDNTMKSMVESFGMEYVEAHRAINDTIMMKAAFDKGLRPLVEKALSDAL